MVSRYSVFQYVPDPIAGERANFGVAAYDESTVLVRFLQRWRRIRGFAGKDISFLRDFARRVEESVDPSALITDAGPVVRLNDELIRRMSGRWIGSIQVTEPRASLLPVPQLLDQVSLKFLRQTDVRRREGLTRRTATAAVIAGVRAALEDESPQIAPELLKPHGVLQGRLSSSRFDAVVENGYPVLAAHGLSFQGGDAAQTEKDVNAVSFNLSDVRQRYSEMPLALVAIPPRFDISGQFERAKDICAGLEVDVVGVEEVEAWARPVIHNYLS